ncbi:molybdenum cofactor guanylyltransferase [Marinitenerispora sediminis]|uniref:Molybdenum cofactor guanylyltransferase n=1 Tax=Marinitenerispora sediminis TaxID=1931232 RepID=A0A368T5N5_9ACTN|nr:NTP transferase domain-containing protein [Marinitenerispora sediminis]RCV57436.1 molybdenum cofactor guanylyltransferase [Marinitenerispora sediminis]RCV58985.1 molybdenum cofactor guanylyltransferase [Marinitenerispora sediminis]RCV61277.1 molybdenum cofactor guanylyltransferase [Marinitenerispora sediminis]
MTQPEPFDAVVLAGGAGRRMGGVDKPALRVGGSSLLERVAAAVRDSRRLVVVGPAREHPPARYVREDPPGAGPIPALRAGMAEVESPWFALLAGDLPFVTPSDITRLRLAARGYAGAALLDTTGRPQWLLGVWHTATLRAALGGYTGASLRGLLSPLRPALLAARDPADRSAFDCDTPQALAQARAAFRAADRDGGGPAASR